MKQHIIFPALALGALLLVSLAGCPLEAGNPGSSGGTSPSTVPVALKGVSQPGGLVVFANSDPSVVTFVDLRNYFRPEPAGADFGIALPAEGTRSSNIDISTTPGSEWIVEIQPNINNEVEEITLSIDVDGDGISEVFPLVIAVPAATSVFTTGPDVNGNNALLTYTGTDDVLVFPQFAYVGRGQTGTVFTTTVQLKELYIPANNAINDYAFSGTDLSILEAIAAPNASTIGEKAFSGLGNLSKLESIYAPRVNEIGKEAFSGDLSVLETIYAPNARTIGEKAFLATTSNTALEELLLPSAITIGRAAFSGYAALKELSIPQARSIGAEAFSDSALTELSLPNAQEIGNMAFWSANLTEVSLPRATDLVGDIFSANLESITIGRGISVTGSASNTRWKRFQDRYTRIGGRAGTYVYQSNYNDFRLSYNN
jgi:hypothetical protein